MNIRLSSFTSTKRAKIIVNAFRKKIKRNQSIIDIGCGNGVVSKVVSDYFHLKLTGTDIENYLLEPIDFKKMPLPNKLPFPPKKQFDLAIFNDVLHHTEFQTQVQLISQAAKVANQVLVFELKPTLFGRIFDFLLNKIHNPNMEIPFTYRNQKDWLNVFRKLKLKAEIVPVSHPKLYPFHHLAFSLKS